MLAIDPGATLVSLIVLASAHPSTFPSSGPLPLGTRPYAIAQESANSHLVLLGIGGIAEAERADLERYNDLLVRMPTTVLIRSEQTLGIEV